MYINNKKNFDRKKAVEIIKDWRVQCLIPLNILMVRVILTQYF